MKQLTAAEIRQAVQKMKEVERFNSEKGLKSYKFPIRNRRLFRQMREAGMIYRTKSGVWDLK